MADIFISYAHYDNAFQRFGPDGWIDWLHRALDARLTQIRGCSATIWRDKQGGIAGNSVLTPAIEQALQEAKLFIAVFSPAYFASEWCLKELNLFVTGAASHGGLLVGTRSRLVHLDKLPVLDKSQIGAVTEIVEAPGYTFFTRQADGKPLELLPDGTNSYEAINSLAYDLADVLDELAGKPGGSQPVAAAKGIKLYVAATSSDVKPQRDRLRHELRQFGYTVLPDSDHPLNHDYLQHVRDDLRDSRASVHVIGENVGVMPERSRESVVEIQYGAALDEEGHRPDFMRFCWMPAGLDTSDPDERYAALIARLANDRCLYRGTLEDFKASIEKALKAPKPSDPVPAAASTGDVRSVYLIFEPPDAEAAKRIEDWLYEEGFDMKTPLSEGTDSERRKIDRNYLKGSDAVLIYHGVTNEFWLRKRLNDLEKISGYGRKRPFLARGVVLADPKTAHKERFRDHNYIAIKGFGSFSPAEMEAFVRMLRAVPETRTGTP